ncbi:MAG: DUF3800 domain-containing protein [Lachnospiraceae bacterium]|nr:DUF3800 domain-containing protein [Lachnospiraceae bacterium]
MKELSIFVDESGDWGAYNHHSPYYIITFVFHNQNVEFSTELSRLEKKLKDINYTGDCLHAGPMIRGEGDYEYLSIDFRRMVFKRMMAFVRRAEVRYKSFCIEKRQFGDSVTAISRLSKQISLFIKRNLGIFLKYDIIKVYYDNGQTEVNKILSSVLNSHLDNVEFKRVQPKDYRLFQVADFLCTMTLLRLKTEAKALSRSELTFFESERTLKKEYLKHIEGKEFK